MAEILTQDQIDELLNQLAVDDAEIKDGPFKKRIKDYDFRNPKKISREQIKVLSGVVDALSRHVSAYFFSLLRNYCEFSLASIEEHPYSEYNNSLPDTLMTAIIDIYPTNTPILLDMSNSITFAVIERMLGGNIDSNTVPDRDFTEIELSVAERIFKRLCIFIQDALQNIPDCKVTLRQIDTNSRFIKAIRMEEIVEVVVYNVEMDNIKGTVTACIPYAFIDTAIKAASKDNEKKSFGNLSEDERLKYLDGLYSTPVEIRGILGTAKLSMKDLSDLQAGDVIRLDQKNGDPILVTVNGNKCFWGEPGIKKYSKAIKINNIYNGRPKLL